jgi:hypothetical protein
LRLRTVLHVDDKRTPDFLVRHVSASELVEVKYARDLQSHWGELAPAFEAATRWAQERHASFCVLTEENIRGGLLENAKRLLPLRAAPLDHKVAMMALTNAYALRRPTFRALLQTIPDRQIALATIWKLIARGALCTDLSVPVTLDSDLRPGE